MNIEERVCKDIDTLLAYIECLTHTIEKMEEDWGWITKTDRGILALYDYTNIKRGVSSTLEGVAELLDHLEEKGGEEDA